MSQPATQQLSNTTDLEGTVDQLIDGGQIAVQSDFESPQADLSVNATATPDPVNTGGSLVYTIQVTNNGPDESSEIGVSHQLPNGASFQSSTPAGSCRGSQNAVECQVAPLASGATSEVTVEVKAPTRAHSLSSTTRVSSDTPDPQSANNETTVQTAMEGNGTSTQACNYDTNGNGKIDTPELQQAINDWTAGEINTDLLLNVVNLWVSERSACAATSSSIGGLTLRSVSVNTAPGGIAFQALGEQIAVTSVNIYNLDGRPIFAIKRSSDRVIWNLTTEGGRSVANGVYLYRVTVESQYGQIESSHLRKLIVMR